MKKTLIFLMGLFSLTAISQDTLVIGVKESKPFVYKVDQSTAGGMQWRGITMDILYTYLESNDIPFIIKEYEHCTYNNVIDSVANGDVDIFSADVTITHERLKKVDFTQPYYVTNTSIATLKKDEPSTLKGLFTVNFLESMLILLAFILISGFIMWIVEKDKNDGFDKGLKGIFDGSYFVSATMTTVGYGDVSAKTRLGKVLAFILMWLSLGIVGYMYGNITTALTVAELEDGIDKVSQLKKMKVGTIDGTTSSDFLDENNIKFIHFESAEEGLDAMVDGELDAFVYDKPILQFYTGLEKYSEVVLSDKDFMEQTYGFVIGVDSEIREGLNRTILGLQRSDEWDNIMNKYNLNNE